jgi:two-component system, sensor histidine kinase ChiS
MWFGTKDGLNRYDGRNFVLFQHNPFDSTTISDPYVTKLLEDSRGRIWTGSLSGEVNVLQRETYFFCRVRMNNLSGENLTTNEVTDIAEGPNGDIWIATKGDGLIRVFVHDGDNCNYDFQHFTNDPTNDKSLNSNRVGNLFFDENETFWIGTEDGLNQFVETTGSFDRFVFNTKHPEAPDVPGEFKITSIHLSRAGEFWLGTQTGLIKYDRKTENYVFFPNQYEIFRYGWGSINHVAEDQNGQFWIGTSAGLISFDTITQRYQYFQHDPFNSQSLSHNLVSEVFIDKSGILWIGTSGHGINILDLKSNRFKTLVRPPNSNSRITGFSVRSIFEDEFGYVWISADVLYRWNRKTGSLKSYETSSDYPDEFGNTEAYSIIQASDGFIWVASPQGLFRHNTTTNQSRLYKYSENNSSGLLYQEVNAVFEDRDGTIWIANRNYISKLTNIETGTFSHFRYTTWDSSKDMSRLIFFQDPNGLMWLGTADGLVHFNPAGHFINTYRNDPANVLSLSNNHIKSILVDPFQPEKYLWIGTSGGLNKFNYHAGTFEHYTVRDGLPNEVIYGVLPDDNGNLWLSTNKGLSRFNLQSNTFRNFDVLDGLQSNEFNTGAYFKSKSGEIFFGGIHGLNYFHPKDIIDNPHKPPLVITGLRIGDRYVSNKTDTGLLDVALPLLSDITFSYKDDVITFEFAALDYSAPDKNQYAYKLDGYNSDWITLGNISSATFTNLPHGRYTFRVKGSNNDGVWNEDGLSIAVVVLPPWWHTWWAYGLYSLLFLSLLYGFRRYELNRFNLKNQLEIERVQLDTLRNLDQLKSHFFANLSHEFRTPLTLIIGQIESLLNSEDSRVKKKKLVSVNENAERLLVLINQLLDLSKLEAGKMSMEIVRENMVSYTKSILYSFESLAESNNIAISFSSDRPVIHADIDRDKMEKVLFNLISNAIKFTSPGGKISVSIHVPEPNIIEIHICDTGIGIPANLLPHIFDRFYQIDASNTRHYGGTGIGLALANELSKLHNGSIKVQSKVGEGSQFIVQLPAVGIDESFQEITTSDEKSLAKSSSQIPELSDFNMVLTDYDEIILIVEDNSDVRTFIREQLEQDYKILEASNGREAITVSQGIIPDLIITDLMMPEMDGYEFSKTIRNDEKTSHIPIIMLTAKAGLDPKIEGLEAGIDAYLNKPFHVKELQARVKTLIQQRKNLKKQFSSTTYFKPSSLSMNSVDQSFLRKSIEIIESHIAEEDFKVEDFAESLNMSISQLNRKLNALVDQPAGTFIRSLRLQRSAELINQTDKSIAEICYEVGFNDQAYFSRAFKKQFGKSPSSFRKITI